MDVFEGRILFLEGGEGVCLLFVIQTVSGLLVVHFPFGERFVVEVAADRQCIPQPLLGLLVWIQAVSEGREHPKSEKADI